MLIVWAITRSDGTILGFDQPLDGEFAGMSQAIAGIAPTDEIETTVMTVWPSVAGMRLMGFPIGKVMGSMMANQTGFYIFTVGNLCALLSIPLALPLFFKRVGPFVATRYRVTNKRIVVERGISGKEEKSIDLDRFDRIDVEIDGGQAWYKAGDLVFRSGEVERFRLESVSRPESFESVCFKSHQAYVGIKKALAASA